VALQRRFHLKYFVETGTSHGDTAELGALAFEKVWTIELFGNRLDIAKTHLAGYPHATLLLGSSPTVLTNLLSELDKPTLFWLDAHYAGEPDKPEYECPLLDELRALSSLTIPGVILIDDARMFNNPPGPPHDPAQWPTRQQIMDVLNSCWRWYCVRPFVRQIGDVFCVTPEAIDYPESEMIQ